MSKHIQLGEQIADTHRALAHNQARLYTIGRAIEERETTVKAGTDLSEAKNDTARKLAWEVALSSDGALKELCRQRDHLKEEELRLQGELDAYCAERRAAEWEVRARLADGLNERAIQTNHRGGHEIGGPEDGAFDDVMDQGIDEDVAAIWGDWEPPY